MDESVNELGNEWNIFIEYKEDNEEVDIPELKAAVKAVLPKCIKSGLPIVCIDTLISVLEKINCESEDDAIYLDILKILIPNQPLSDDLVKRLILWFRSRYKGSPAHHYFTYWFLICVKIGLIRKELVESYFTPLLFLFLQDIHEDALSHILVFICKKNTISPNLLKQLVDKYNKTEANKEKKQLAVILKYAFDTIPQYLIDKLNVKCKKILVPYSLEMKDVYLNKILTSIIRINTNIDDQLDCNGVLNSLNVYKDETNYNCYFGIIPSYEDKEDVSMRITSLTQYEQVLKHYNNIIVPSNIISILQCKCGPLYLSYSSESCFQNLEQQINHMLIGILNNEMHDKIIVDKFLKSLVIAQTVMCETIPCVSSFTKNYLIIWDGVKYREQIISLIPWLLFSSFNDMIETLNSLYNIFLSADLECSIVIIDALAELYVNMMNCHLRNKKKLHNKLPKWMRNDAENMLNSYTSMLEEYVNTGLIMHANGSAFLIATLKTYLKIFICEKENNFQVLGPDGLFFTILPVSVVLMCQSSTSITVYYLLFLLLTCYWEEQDQIMSNSYNQSTLNTFKIIEKYSRDTLKILLLEGVNGNNINELMVGSLLSDSDKMEFNKLMFKVDNLLSVTKNFSTSHIINELAKKMKLDITTIPPQKFIYLIEHIAPKISILVNKLSTALEMFETETFSTRNGDFTSFS